MTTALVSISNDRSPEGYTNQKWFPDSMKALDVLGHSFSTITSRGRGSDNKCLILSREELDIIVSSLHRPSHLCKGTMEKLLRMLVSMDSPVVKEKGQSVIRRAVRDMKCWGCLTAKVMTSSQVNFNQAVDGDAPVSNEQGDSGGVDDGQVLGRKRRHRKGGGGDHGNPLPNRAIYRQGQRPWQVVQMDIAGPYFGKNFYWVALVDTFSKFALLKSTMACPVGEDCIRLLDQVRRRYLGDIQYIVTDNGSQFREKTKFAKHAEDLGIKVEYAPPEAHWFIGQVERFHKTVLGKLAAEKKMLVLTGEAIDLDPKTFDVIINSIEVDYNSSSEGTGLPSPAECVFRYQCKPRQELFSLLLPSEEATTGRVQSTAVDLKVIKLKPRPVDGEFWMVRVPRQLVKGSSWQVPCLVINGNYCPGKVQIQLAGRRTVTTRAVGHFRYKLPEAPPGWLATRPVISDVVHDAEMTEATTLPDYLGSLTGADISRNSELETEELSAKEVETAGGPASGVSIASGNSALSFLQQERRGLRRPKPNRRYH